MSGNDSPAGRSSVRRPRETQKRGEKEPPLEFVWYAVDGDIPLHSKDHAAWFLFHTFGFRRQYGHASAEHYSFVETNGLRTSRRNIIALASFVVLAGLAGANPQQLDVFGVRPSDGPWGATVLAAAVVFAQLYWYCLKFFHSIQEGAAGDDVLEYEGIDTVNGKTKRHRIFRKALTQKTANWSSNCVAFYLTLASWCVVGRWIVEAWS